MPYYTARPKRFRSRGTSEDLRRFSPVRLGYVSTHRSELTEKAWESALQGLGKQQWKLDGRNTLDVLLYALLSF